MKNKTFYLILSGVILIGGIFAILQFTSSPASAYLSEEEAKAKVQEQYAGEIKELELEEDGNKKVYEIEIEGQDKYYELHLDAETGEILKLEEKKLANSSNTNSSKSKEEQQNNTSSDNKEETNSTKQTTLISYDEAKKIALEEYNGTITDFELDEDDGKSVYEIEVQTKSEEVDLEIDAYTGDIISISKDELDD
ncbi:PepSY domain-containing protein [Gracilibacillus dipsosauri]|uniref:PepSY domain-containing protein n=1 Tax=Gracilibacillus dipsosauri TaxID=178340 RepID=A0A317L3Q6_9BACI|nr:PepSY domain-containing protein [Gracilibacillus dipsosauri]PWU70146.1 hypothetical protein DLJ74_01380 [Gracilibacillus dipsosauri]